MSVVLFQTIIAGATQFSLSSMFLETSLINIASVLREKGGSLSELSCNDVVPAVSFLDPRRKAQNFSQDRYARITMITYSAPLKQSTNSSKRILLQVS